MCPWGISDGGKRADVVNRIPDNVNRCKQANHTAKEMRQIDDSVKLLQTVLDGGDPNSAVSYSISGGESVNDVGTGCWANIAIGAPVIVPGPVPGDHPSLTDTSTEHPVTTESNGAPNVAG